MKAMPLFSPLQAFSLAAFCLFGPVSSSPAQPGTTNNYPFPVVTVLATDPFASESGATGTFTLFRDGATNYSLNVFCLYGGTASNGVDYVTLPRWVIIPAGARTATLTVKPIDDTVEEGTEAVILMLRQSPTMPPVNYSIGYPSNAVVYIADDAGTNIPPTVSILTPTNGASFTTPVDIVICADARDADGYAATVEFFAGTTSLGIRTNNPYSAGPMNPFCLIWSNVPPGNYVLTATATDNGGAATTSDPVNISVQQGPPPPPPTNQPPVVRIISPPNGAVFHAPVDIPIYAYARDPDGAVASVEFLAGTNSLGFGNLLPCPTNPPCPLCPIRFCPTNLYLLVWSNAPLGAYGLTALATDTRGAASVSATVNITILPSPPPPTNRPPIVNIIATDPLAIEGTNCWPWLGMTNSSPAWTNWPGASPACRFYTNCGPKSATFTVHRFGLTNDALTVNYAIAGTASNGVDYATLPGAVTIPAGARSASVTIVPIDDGLPDITSTVILRLLPDTNYIVGFPPRAAAIILDSNRPRPATGLLPDRCFHLNASGPDGAWFHIEYTTDLLHWTPVCTNQVIQGSIDFVDPDAPGEQVRLYRAVPENNPPPE